MGGIPDQVIKELRGARPGCLCAILLGPTVLIAIPALAILVLGAVEMETQRRLMMSPRQVDATVLSAAVDVHSHRGHSKYVPQVEYSYEIDGKQMVTSGVFPVPWLFRLHAEAETEVAPFSAGDVVPAYVDPQDPSRAYLVPAWSGGPHLSVAAGGAALSSLATIHMLLLGWRSARAATALLIVSLLALWVPGGVAAAAYFQQVGPFGPNLATVLFALGVALSVGPLYCYLRMGRLRQRVEAAEG
ncbi:MAG: DUF3592 domain-containing protein [Phycisphaerales bacterium JB039]